MCAYERDGIAHTGFLRAQERHSHATPAGRPRLLYARGCSIIIAEGVHSTLYIYVYSYVYARTTAAEGGGQQRSRLLLGYFQPTNIALQRPPLGTC